MPKGKGQAGSPSLAQPGLLKKANKRFTKAERLAKPPKPAPRFVLEDGQSVEIAYTGKPRGRPKSGPKPVVVTLQMRHSINGKFYGPGTVTLSEGKARTLLNTEHEAMHKEDSLVRQQAFIIQFRNGVPMRREVPAGQFDNILMREELPLTNMGGMR